MPVEPNHVYVIPPERGHRHPPAARSRSRRAAAIRAAAPAGRLLLSRARRGSRQSRDRRRALGNRLGRHRGAPGDQGGERHHLRAGSRLGEVRRDAAQRGQRRRRRRGAAAPRPRRASSVRLSRHPYFAGSPATRRRPGDAETLKKIFVVVRNAVGRRLRRVQAGDASSGGSRRRMALRQRRTAARLPGCCSRGTRRGARALRGHPHPRHVVLPGSGRLRALKARRLPDHPEAQGRRARRSGSGSPAARPARRSIRSRSRCSSSCDDAPARARSRSSAPTSASGHRQGARAASIPTAALRDVSDERRRRYFTKVDRGYRINKIGARSVRLRPARPRARSAVLEAGSRELPQRPHLLRSGAAEAGHRRRSTTA